MMWIIAALIGATAGASVHGYIRHFSQRLEQDIWQAYQCIFACDYPMPNSQLKPIQCLPRWCYLMVFMAIALICYALSATQWQALISFSYLLLVFCIARIDMAYQLISSTLCQMLFVLGLGAAYVGATDITLGQSMQSSLLGLASFYGIYVLAKLYYGKEAFGRGDYWLIFGLASFMHWQQLPLFVFMACVYALLYVLYAKWQGAVIQQIPFAPFLIAGASSLLLLNHFLPSMILQNG
ncbi:prepilin peptidase [[Haemophilus] felis]|uniref:Prepilin type IV endopeptidase peptidase domain-containing protein n=1 Tax=[Haemophilus] felis TaxID=123822 RepID=A0A1T0B6B4_9PAST|nr:prepilin peptidase [[Haemophilus] felis]NBI40853.1 prepilin peptidase [[Haemophilus] felis]NBI42345.1 prepilin peptidase [[Haemophilus] felis]OOS05556.1 hypothetical protein B0188_03865 [[Haemophilus] felis]